MPTRLERRVVPKSASYTINPYSDRPGTVFTNGGASAPVTFTLPPPSMTTLGWWYRFVAVVNQNLVVVPPVADTLVVPTDLDADSIGLVTGGQIIGGEIECQVVNAGTPTVPNYRWQAKAIAGSTTPGTLTYTVTTA